MTTVCCGLPCPADTENPEPHRAQRFFANLLAEARRPTFGDKEREFIQTLAIRAQEAGIYDPGLGVL